MISMVNQWKTAALVASGTVLLDYLGHLYFTSPMEIPQYFVAKWFGALFATLIAFNWDIGTKLFRKPWGAALTGATVFAVYAGVYYGVIAPLLRIPVLAPPNTIAIFGVVGAANNVLWAGLHFGAYYASYRIMQVLLRTVMRYG